MKSECENQVDDASLQYVLKSRPIHDRVKQAATQVAGLSLLIMLRRASAFDFRGQVGSVEQALSEVRLLLSALKVPPQAAHHHRHLLESSRAIERAVAMIAAVDACVEEASRRELTVAVRLATDHLKFAERALPGFEIDLGSVCCAAHALPLEPAELHF